jgi:tripartite-type tricarboxylate transporter receptor subunit TctC
VPGGSAASSGTAVRRPYQADKRSDILREKAQTPPEETMLSRRHLLALTGSSLIAGVSARAAAQDGYASRMIRMLVGYPAGGGVDIVARLLGEPISATVGQSVIVENRTGALATIATNAVAKSPGDGYTLLMAASGEISVNQHLFKDKLAYDASRDLVPVALVGIVPCVIVVGANLPIKNAKELVAYAKDNPGGKVTFSTGGVGGPQHLAGEMMNRMAGVDMLHVPYRGSAPAVTDVATGAVTMSFSSLAVALPLMQDNKIRAVAVTSNAPMPQLPDVAPLSEGAPNLAGYELLNWFGLFAPAGTPMPIVNRLNGIVNKAIESKALADKLLVQGIVPRPMDAPAFKKFVDDETEKFGKLIKEAKITLGN